jgi:KDO2-lipid IV(A) lauroyltransferase
MTTAERRRANARELRRVLATIPAAPRPSWIDLKAGGAARRRWLVAWLWEWPLDGLQWVLFHGLRLLPVALASSFGGVCARLIVPWFDPAAIARSKANLRLLEPGWSEARVREATARHFENVGRYRAEFPLLTRLLRAGRITVENAQVARDTMAAGPVILVGNHVGNWELICPVTAALGVPIFAVFEAQPSRMQNRLSLQARIASSAPGSCLYTRSSNAPRAALRWLKAGRTLLIFCDEAVGGLSIAPFFGRPPHLRSNYAFAVRFARLTGATLLPFHVVRRHGCRFTLRFEAPLRLAPASVTDEVLLDDVARLNAVVEPVVRQNLDQWHWLDWTAPDLDPHGRR